MNTFCSYYNEKKCRSCTLINQNYDLQVQQKESILKEALRNFKVTELLPTIQSSQQRFRNKAKFSVTGTLDKPVIGILRTDDLDQGIELLNCPLHVEPINALLSSLKEFIKEAKLVPYQISEKRGELKGIIIFHSELVNETYVRFILRSKESFDRIKKHSLKLIQKHPHLKCLSINIQPIPHAILEGEEEVYITDRKFISLKTNDVEYSVDPKGFIQTNQGVAEKLYQTSATWVKKLDIQYFLELFSGQGAFSFFCSPHVQKGLGIEINPEAVKAATETAKLLKLDHLNFIASDAGKVGTTIDDFGPDCILVNPPRRGIGEASKLLLDSGAKHLIYSSCNYLSLVTDLKELSKLYRIEKVQIFDMFPHTEHFETLVHLIR